MRQRRAFAAGELVLLLLCCAGVAARADENAIVTAARTIYPGDVIDESMVRYRAWDGATGGFAREAADVIGKIARRTLLAGQPIAISTVDEPLAVRNGAAVRLVYSIPGLSIVANGQALQAGRRGAAIRARNADSGVIVSGIVGPDGVVLVDR